MAWAVIVLVDILADRVDQFLDVTEDAAAKPALSEVRGSTLHHVQPRATGRREVDVESGVTSQPPLHLGMLMGSVIVRNQVDLPTPRCDFVDDTQKFQPFLVTMPVVAHADNGPVERIHRGK